MGEIEANKSKRTLILINVVLVTFMSTLQGSIIDVALPTMARSLSVTTEAISWVVTTFLIVVTSTILVFGKLGDIKGKIKIFQFGLILFTLGCLLCGISTSYTALIFSRIIQAIGAAGTMANNQGIIAETYPKNERGRALGISGSFVALGNLVGPPLGGMIISFLNWNYIFLVNVPIGIIVYLMGTKILPRSEDRTEEKLDLKGAILLVSTIGLFFIAITFGRNIGFTNPAILAAFAAAMVAAVIFVRTELKLEKPVLQFGIFSNKLFSLSIFCSFTSFIALFCLIIIQPFYLQYALKYTPAETGLIMMVNPVVMFIVAPLSGRLSDKIGSEFLTFLGLSITSAALLLMSSLTQYTNLLTLIAAVMILSGGNALFQSPNTSLIMSTVTHDRLGIAGSINAFVRNLGMVFGATMATILLYDFMSLNLGKRVATLLPGYENAFIFGMKYVFIVAASICMVGALLTAYRLYRRRLKHA
ncbi:MAG TPA: MFS transporter [Clostridia bacterium]|nr:MFS transporter [Clostridia bacterium]